MVAILSLGAVGLLFRLMRDFETSLENHVADLRRVFSDVDLLKLPDQPQISFAEIESQVAKYENHGDFREITITKFYGPEDRVVYPFYLPAFTRGEEWKISPPAGFQHPLPWRLEPDVRVLPLASDTARLGTLYVRLSTRALTTVRVLIGSLLGVFGLATGLFLLQFRRQERAITRTTIQLEEKRRELVRLERLALAGQLSANIFHDLKKPVLNIKNEVEELTAEHAGPEGLALRMKEQVELFFGILRDGSLDRFVRADDDVQFVDVNELVERSLALVRYERGDVEIVQKLRPGLPPVLAEPVRLIQVFSNLVLNAYQAMGRRGRLAIESDLEADRICVRLEDNGPGISPDKLSQIFEPFFTTKPAGEGTGLGLYIVRDILREAGGDVQVASQPGSTTFTVWLPLPDQ